LIAKGPEFVIRKKIDCYREVKSPANLHSPYVSRRLGRANGFRWLLEGVLTPQTPAALQLHSFIGVGMEVAEAALHRPSRAWHTASSNAFATLSGGS
jgi:hypothetical protein